MGQEEFYGEQYGHTPSSSEPINQQYYPDGNHTDPHTHSYKQITCLSTSLKHLPHLLLLPHLLFLFPGFFFFFLVYFVLFFSFLHVHTHWQFINSKVRCVFLVLDEFCLFFILSIFKPSLRTDFFFFLYPWAPLVCRNFRSGTFFLFLFVYGIRYRDVCSTYCRCIWLDKKCRFFVFHYWELNECWNDVYKINNTVHLQPPITIGGTLLYLPAALNLIGQTQTSSFRRKLFS